MKLEYYTAKDVKEKVGCCLSKSYELIDKLNKTLKEEYPQVIVVDHKIPIWYWNYKTNPSKEVINEN